MSRFTIVSSVYNEYELLRQFIESIKYSVDPETYDKVVIVDDFSRKDGPLRKYENFINSSPDKFNIINFDEYRHVRWYQSGFALKEVSSRFDWRVFDNDKPNLGVCSAYQLALEHVKTEFVVICDTDCVFLSKFDDTLNQIAELYDQYPKAMAISQLQGHGSSDVFESNTIGMKHMPHLIKEAGGPSPMFSTFRIAAWTEHGLIPIASTPWRRRGYGFGDFNLSVVGMGYSFVNFPFYSKDYVYHIGGGTARRNTFNKGNPIHPYGSAANRGHYEARVGEFVHDWYSGAHYINMNSDTFTDYLKEKYKLPMNQMAAPFDEKMLKKLILSPSREKGFQELSPDMVEKLERFSDAERIKKDGERWWNHYTYGKPSDIDWPNTTKQTRNVGAFASE